MAKARKVRGAWGNALGGFRKQKRNNYGQFSRTGASVKREKTPTFKKGGSPRYYAPGGKTYSTKKNTHGFAPSVSNKKQERRAAGYAAAMERKKVQQRKSRNRKIAIGVGAAAVIGGAIAYKKYSANGSSGPLAAHPPRLAPGSALTSGVQTINGRAVSDNVNIADRIGQVGGRAQDFRNANNYRRRERASGVTDGAAATPPTVDDGFSAAKATVAKAVGGISVASSVLRNVQNVHADATRLVRMADQMDEDGVSRVDRHRPTAQHQMQSFSDFTNLADLNNARNKYESLGIQSTYADPRAHFIVENAEDMGPKLMSRSTVGGSRGYIRTLAEGDYDEHNPEQRRVNDRYGDAAVAGKTDWRGNAARRSSKDMDFKPGFSARDIHGQASSDAEYMAQVKSAQEISGGAGNWANKKPRDLAAEGMKATSLAGVKSSVNTAKKVTGHNMPTHWDGDAQDKLIQYERRQAARRGLADSQPLHQSSNKDSLKYDVRGEAIEVINYHETQVNKELRLLKDSKGENPFWTGDFDPDEGPITNLAKKGPLVGQPIPKTMDLTAPAKIYNDPTTGEKAAAQFLQDYERKQARGETTRYDRQMKQFLMGERAKPPVKDLRGKLTKEQNAAINRRERARNARRRAQG